MSGSADATFDAAQDTVAVGFLGDAGLDFGNLAEAVSNLVAAEDVLQQQNDSDRAVAESVSRSVQGGDGSSGLGSLGLLAEDYGSESDPDSQSALRDAQTSIAAAHPIAATNRYAIFNDDDEDVPDDELHADQIAAETATTAGATPAIALEPAQPSPNASAQCPWPSPCTLPAASARRRGDRDGRSRTRAGAAHGNRMGGSSPPQLS